MILKSNYRRRHSIKIISLSFTAVLSIVLLFVGQSLGDKAKKLDAKVDSAIERFYEHIKDGREVARMAKGLLILPSVKKGAFIVGGEYGRGALRINGKTVDYYSMASGSIGFQIGGQARDFVLAFMSTEALKKFRASKGWEAGVDGNVALVTLGAGGSAISAMEKNPIVAFVYDVKGLIADISIKGAKFNKLDLSK
jgi:lipid-binding SYLF domain-containing protein